MMRLMKNTPIIYMASVLALIAGTSSCIKEAQFQMPAGTNCIKVRLVEPEIQVKSTEISDDMPIYLQTLKRGTSIPSHTLSRQAKDI